MKVWCFDPHSGGTKIPPAHHSLIIMQADAHAIKQSWYPRFKVKLRFKNQFCYLDGLEEGKKPFPVGRLRYFECHGWSFSFFAYSSESYKPCIFGNGSWFGTLEEAIDKCSMYFR